MPAEPVPSLYTIIQPPSRSPHTNPTMSFTRFARAPTIRSLRQFSTTPPSRQTTTIPYISTCPSPTCECASTPPDLDIDRKTPLLNTMAPYSEQVIFCTGQDDWTSNIEQEPGSTGDFVKGLKSIIGKGGEAFDVGSFPTYQISNLLANPPLV